MFEFGPTSTSTPTTRKRKAFEHKSPDYAMSEEPLWLAHNASIEEQEETSQLGDSKDDDGESLNGGKNGDKHDGNSSTHCNF